MLSAAAARGIGQILHVRFRPAAGEGEHELARPRLTVAAGLGKRVLGGAGDGEGLHAGEQAAAKSASDNPAAFSNAALAEGTR